MTGVEDNLGAIFLLAVFANNLVLEWQLALCPLLAGSRRISVAASMAIVTIIVMTLTSVLSYLVYAHILVPLGITHLSLLILLLLMVGLLQSAQIIIAKRWPVIAQQYGMFLPLLTMNCAMLGMVLLMLESVSSLGSALFYGFGAACGFALLLIILASLRERLAMADAPLAFSGTPLLLISLGILSMAYHGF